jgi:hypothetical protein
MESLPNWNGWPRYYLSSKQKTKLKLDIYGRTAKEFNDMITRRTQEYTFHTCRENHPDPCNIKNNSRFEIYDDIDTEDSTVDSIKFYCQFEDDCDCTYEKCGNRYDRTRFQTCRCFRHAYFYKNMPGRCLKCDAFTKTLHQNHVCANCID